MLANARYFGLVGLVTAVVVIQTTTAQDAVSPDLPAVSIEQFLPIESAALTVGPVALENRSTGISQPFFLIGCDDISREWLRRNRTRLIELHAFGLVVDAPDAVSYRRMELIAEGLVIRPVVGDLIAEHLGVSHYPVLITADGLFP